MQLLDKQLLISSRPLHTIKVAAEAMIMVHESNPIPVVLYQPPEVSPEEPEPRAFGPSKISTSNEVMMNFNKMGAAMSQGSRIANDDTESSGWREAYLAELDSESNPRKRRRLLLSDKEPDPTPDNEDLDNEEPLTSFWVSDDDSFPLEVQREDGQAVDVFGKIENFREGDFRAHSEMMNRMIDRWIDTISGPWDP